jgi:AcrR family transcriptional regulator
MIVDDVPTRIEIRRARVAEAARDLFARHGFHATGIAQIADVSGIKVQQIYRDFCNKEGIVAAIVATDVGDLFTEISQIGAQASGGRAALRAWIRLKLLKVMSKDHPPLFLEIFAEASRNPRIAAILQEIDLQAREALVEAFTAFAAPGTDAAHLRVVGDLFLTFIGGLSERPVAHPGLEGVRLADMMCDMIVAQIPLAPAHVGHAVSE